MKSRFAARLGTLNTMGYIQHLAAVEPGGIFCYSIESILLGRTYILLAGPSQRSLPPARTSGCPGNNHGSNKPQTIITDVGKHPDDLIRKYDSTNLTHLRNQPALH
jgi:hypothetical protein